MIEDAMLFALGFCAATLLALACLPALWHRALRLTRRRLEMLVPLSAAEVSGQRDGIRAEAAVAQRRLEQKLEKAEHGAAELAASLGRRTAELVMTEQARDAALSESRSLSEQLARTAANLVQAESECGGLQLELGQVELRLKRSEDERQAADERSAELQNHLEVDRGALAALDTKVSGLAAHIEDLDAAIIRLGSERDALKAANDVLTHDREAVRSQLLLEAEQRAIVQRQLKDEVNRTADRSVRMQAKSEALARAERQIMEQTAEIKASAVALAHLKQRFEALQATLIARVASPNINAKLSEDELLDLRKAVINAADDALLLLHNPVNSDMLAPKKGATSTEGRLPVDRSSHGAEAVL